MTKPGLPVTVLAVAVSNLFGCGGGCDGMTPIPGGFPSAERTANAGQVRVSTSGLAAITADPAALVGGLLGSSGGLTFEVPANCAGSPSVCCPGGNPVSPCGPIEIDLEARPGDQPRLEIMPVQGGARLDVVLRARVRTAMDVPVNIPVVGDCGLVIDTAPGANADIRMALPINFVQDAQAGTTRVEVGAATITQLTADDVSLSGGFGCQFANLGVGLFLDTLVSTFEDAIAGAVGDQVCKACPTGDVDECGPFASACTDNVCMKADDTCVQELGLTGRMAGSALFATLSPGTVGSIDLYEVAGGYATTNQLGLALGLLGGMLPAGAERDRCGPPGTAPAAVTIPQSSFFQGNTRPDTSAPFDLAIGIHENQLDRFAYAAYDGGLLCLTLTTASVDLLTTSTIGLVAPSLGDLVEAPSPVAIGLRPQSPPTIVLGTNTFVDDGAGGTVVGDPLLDINFTAMELDFFAALDDQYVRLFTVVADVHLPVNLQVDGNGELLPVLGDIDEAFTNISVKNSEALLESPADLAAVFPTLLGFALPQLTGALGSFALPEIAGLRIDVTDITAVDNVAFMAIFAELEVAAMAAPAPHADRVTTSATLAAIEEPELEVAADPARWDRASRPRAVLELGGDQPGLEWSVRVDGSTWSPWSAAARRTISPRSFWLPGTHRVEVQARRVGEARSADLTPVVLAFPLGDALIDAPLDRARAGQRDFHGQASESGCGCASGRGGGAGDGLLLGLVGAALLWRRRRVRPRRAALLIVAAGALAGPGCNCGGDPAPCGDVECLDGELAPGSIGRWNDVASDGTRTVISTYDRRLGDLVLIDRGDPLVYTAIDGIPADVDPTYDPATYRGGVEGAGPDVGAWSSVALHGGRARIAYQDRGAEALKFAYEGDDGAWHNHVVDRDADVATGRYASLAIPTNGNPAIAYLATGVAGAAGTFATELRLARASSPTPGDGGDWTIEVLATAPASCAGLCGAGQSCAVAAVDTDPPACVTEGGDCGVEGCASGEVCVAGACRAELADPSVTSLPDGAGLFADLLVLPDGRLAVVHYDRVRTALVLLVDGGAGWAETILDGETGGDRGMWATAVVDGSGLIHVAYQDALGDQVFYTNWNGSAGPVELVDDGGREGDRAHPVGAGAAIFLDGGSPAVAYQDGLVSDLVLSRRTGADAWTRSNVATGDPLDGFHVAASTDGATLVWERIDAATTPLGELIIQ